MTNWWAVLFLAVSWPVIANAQSNWPRFRGSDATGVAANDMRLPMTWSKTSNVAWSIEVDGEGWSSPIVWGNKVFLTSVTSDAGRREPQKGLYLGEGVRTPSPGVHHWWVHCIDLITGEKHWTKEAYQGNAPVPRHPKSSYAAETPVTDGEHIFVLFGDVGLCCYDFAGIQKWYKSIEAKKTFWDYGVASSPVLHDDKVFVLYDNLQESWLAAFDKATGEEVWKVSRDETHSWATPFVWQNEMRTEIVVPGVNKIRSYDLDGKVLWELSGRMSSLVIPSPFSANGLCYVASGYVVDANRPTFAFKPGGNGDITNNFDFAHNEFIAWHAPKSAPYNTSQLAYSGNLYTLFDRGFFACQNALTGVEIYGKQRFRPSGTFTASPWAYNDRIFCLSEDGMTYVIKPGETFEIEHTNSLDELCLATPAIADGNLLIRTATKLYCIRNLDASGSGN